MEVLNEFLKTKGIYSLVMILFFLGVYGMVLSKKLHEEADGDECYAGCRNLFLSVFCTEGWRNDSYPERPDNRS